MKRPASRARPAPVKTAAPAGGLRSGLRVGLFGGSFNPAHEGHLHVSLEAIKRLGLDELWWLVSPQNPLKPTRGMAPFEQRLAAARRLARHPAIRVSDCERRWHSHYSADTIERLRRRHPRHRFVWVMGADNLADFERWRRWQDIFKALPIAIFDRRTYAQSASASKPLKRFGRYRLPERAARLLALQYPPVWTYFHGRLHAASSSAIRAGAADPRNENSAAGRNNERGDGR
ncbi:MAG: nicotinate-nucleotide adenylyltransferase [Proteobacteria bacterium]|nr:nicotinate-nucleotide adenylyltransferase [Pseudomonadota bacterium]